MADRLHRLIEWPLWSWKRLCLTAAGLLVLLALVGKASSALSPETPKQPVQAVAPQTVETPAGLPTPTETLTPPAAPSAATPTAALTGTAAAAACQAVAARFATAWVQTQRPTTEWLEGLRAAATSTFLDQLATSDPTRVPASRVLGDPAVVASSPTGATFRVVTDGGRVDIVTQQSGGGCLVSDLQPAENVPGGPTPVLTAAGTGG